MPEFLLEVGCEELPASFVEKAYGDLRDALCKELTELGVCGGGATACGTPRRLIVHFPNLKDRQEDSVKEQRGPSLQAAFDAAGEPTKALLGFCKSQGIEPSDLRRDEQYVWVTKHVGGLPTSELLESILPRIILGLNFEKSMRWGASRARFARPIRWILAAYDGRALDFNVEGVPAALISYGHRFYAPDPFEAKSFGALVSELKNRFVEVDSKARKASILAQAKSISNGVPEITEDLLDENTFLTEWPTAILGSFPESYLELPEPVLVTAMAKHERMFPIRNSNTGKLSNQFIFIRNSGDDETVRKGCEWVLGARFNDARFFYEQDQKLTLDDFLAKTEGVVFQAQLGSVRQRADRLASLAEAIALHSGADEAEQEYARLAGLYAKADLATGLVSELSSLQGVIGASYAAAAGLPPEVSYAMAQQYRPTVPNPTNAAERTAVRLRLADQLDKLAGYLGLKIVPTGSSDPFGLRRAVTTIINDTRDWTDLKSAPGLQLDAAQLCYENQGFTLDDSFAYHSLREIFDSRYPVLWGETVRADIISAATGTELFGAADHPRMAWFRTQVLSKFSPEEVQTSTRPLNLIAAAKKKGEKIGAIDEIAKEGLNSAEGTQLHEALTGKTTHLNTVLASFDVAGLVAIVRELLPLINTFFDNTMVMSEDPTERFHRLALAELTSQTLLLAGDFTKLEG
ncbi:MAG: glycine--tRNA ligase subunit beta [Armatimonadota bacterium]